MLRGIIFLYTCELVLHGVFESQLSFSAFILRVVCMLCFANRYFFLTTCCIVVILHAHIELWWTTWPVHVVLLYITLCVPENAGKKDAATQYSGGD